ncbi:MAG TPA: dTMP kinase, partial [Ignavibacteriaceae bacterium]
SVDAILNIHNLAIGKTIPDITFFIDIPNNIALARKKNIAHSDLDRIEVSDDTFYERVREGYLYLAKKEKRFRVIDGTRNIKQIHEQIINEIKSIEGVK